MILRLEVNYKNMVDAFRDHEWKASRE